MSELPNTTNINAPLAPDPTARIENDPDEAQPKPNFLHSIGIPTDLATAKAFGIRHYLIKIISVVTLIHGTYLLYEHLHEIFFVLPKLPEAYKALNFSQDIYNSILYKSIILSATSLIETILGLSLISKHSKTIHNLHVFATLSLLILSYVLLELLSPIKLHQIEQLEHHALATLQFFLS